MEEFVYLGSKVNQSGCTEENTRARIKMANLAFAVLRLMWKNTAIYSTTKIRILASMYGADTWRVSKTRTYEILTFTNKCLRQIP